MFNSKAFALALSIVTGIGIATKATASTLIFNASYRALLPIFLSAFFVFSLSAAPSEARPKFTSHGDNWSVGTHCGENVPLFNAQVEGSDKIVSICEHEGGGDELAGLSYHFGKLGEIEFNYPSKFGASWNDFTFRAYVRPKTTYQKLEFDNGGYRYAILEENDNGDFSAFLRITRISDRRVVLEKKLKLTTEPLALVKISGRVHRAPYDE
jgi:hypothetical protein